MGYLHKKRPKSLALLSVDILLDIADVMDDIQKGRGKDDVDFFIEDLKFVQESARILSAGLEKRRKKSELQTNVSKPTKASKGE
jgi:hypothetical protein